MFFLSQIHALLVLGASRCFVDEGRSEKDACGRRGVGFRSENTIHLIVELLGKMNGESVS